MEKIQQKNLSLDFVKLIASCLVVFIHAKFPGRLGSLVACLARFAVPFFFAVSGYYSFGVDRYRIQKRMGHVLKLHLIAIILVVLIDCAGLTLPDFMNYIRGDILLTKNEWLRWILVQDVPYGDQIWFLTALLQSYGILWVYTVFWEGRTQKNVPLYQAAFALFAIFCTMTQFFRLEGLEIPLHCYRNSWLFGLPMFAAGMFLHEYKDQIWHNFRLTDTKLVLLILLGAMLSVLDEMAGDSGELPSGMILLVPALLLYLSSHPQLPIKAVWVQKIASRFGVMSTAVYILHVPVKKLYYLLFPEGLGSVFGSLLGYVYPLVILTITFIGALFWERIDWFLHQMKRHS